MSRFLIILSVVFLIAGLLWPILTTLGVGRLPGDFVIERKNLHIYFPLATSLLISVVLSRLVADQSLEHLAVGLNHKSVGSGIRVRQLHQKRRLCVKSAARCSSTSNASNAG